MSCQFIHADTVLDRFCFLVSGEQGRAVNIVKEKLSGPELVKYELGWNHNAFNEYASNMISLHRSLPDVRDVE